MNEAKKIRESATKIVFLLISIAFIWLTWVGKIDPTDFVTANMMILSFYFWQKVNYNIKNDNDKKGNESLEQEDQSWL